MTTFLASLFAILVFTAANADSQTVCTIGQEPDPENNMKYRWVVPVMNPCRCSQLRMAGMKHHVTNRPYAVTYHDDVLVSNDRTEIREWLNCGKECKTVTSAQYGYTYLANATDVSRIEFEVKAASNAHISLVQEVSNSQTDMYEVVIGAGRDKFSTIRRCKLACSKKTHFESGFLSSSHFRAFWITFDMQSGRLAVGKEGLGPFIEWTDPEPLGVKYLGFSTGFGSTGVFRYSCDISAQPATTWDKN